MRQLVFRWREPSSSPPEHGAALFPIDRGLISPGRSRWTNRQGRWLGTADLKNGLVLLSLHPTQAGSWCNCPAQRPYVSLTWCPTRTRSCKRARTSDAKEHKNTREHSREPFHEPITLD